MFDPSALAVSFIWPDRARDCSGNRYVINCCNRGSTRLRYKTIVKLLRALGLVKGRDKAPVTHAQAVNYKGCVIVPTPRKVAAGWTTEGDILKEIDGMLRSDHFIRADTCSERDDAVSYSILKAKRIIDERGDALFAERPSGRG